MKLNTGKCIIMFILSFIIMLVALIQIPRLQDLETCVSAAFIITLAYGWFCGVIWANVVLPMMRK